MAKKELQLLPLMVRKTKFNTKHSVATLRKYEGLSVWLIETIDKAFFSLFCSCFAILQASMWCGVVDWIPFCVASAAAAA